jgi:hypothetical protein
MVLTNRWERRIIDFIDHRVPKRRGSQYAISILFLLLLLPARVFSAQRVFRTRLSRQGCTAFLVPPAPERQKPLKKAHSIITKIVRSRRKKNVVKKTAREDAKEESKGEAKDVNIGQTRDKH